MQTFNLSSFGIGFPSSKNNYWVFAVLMITATIPSIAVAGPMTNRIIVKFVNQTVSPASAASDNTDQETEHTTKIQGLTSRAVHYLHKTSTGAVVFELDEWVDDKELEKELEDMELEPEIEYVEPDRLLQPKFVPDDALYPQQWNYFETVGGMNLPAAWDQTSGVGVVVAVIDTGVRPHADLNSNLLSGYDMISDPFVANDGDGRDANAFDSGDSTLVGDCGTNRPPRARNSSWHGTHVSGTIAAITNNGIGVAGVAFGAKILPVRVLGRCGGFLSDISDGIVWASGGTVTGVPANSNPAQVINLSLGGSGPCSQTQQSAIDTARANGATVVVAAGNEKQNASNSNPANCNGVITVAATNRDGGRAFYSNFGSIVDVAAPGGETRSSSSNGILSTLNTGKTSPGNDSFGNYQGTSMATPHISGLAALLYEVDPSLQPDQVETIIKQSARSFPSPCTGCGQGLADAAEAVVLADQGSSGVDNTLTNDVAQTNLLSSNGQSLYFKFEVPAGASNLSFSIQGGVGDADLYVQYATQPTLDIYDCRPYLNGNNESCTISNIQTGTYHVMIRAFKAFSGVNLLAHFDPPNTGGADNGNLLVIPNLARSTGQWSDFKINIPVGTRSLIATISSGNGDADLYVRSSALPTSKLFNCRPYLNGNNERCQISNPQPGTWYVSLRAFSTYTGVNLNVRSVP